MSRANVTPPSKTFSTTVTSPTLQNPSSIFSPHESRQHLNLRVNPLILFSPKQKLLSPYRNVSTPSEKSQASLTPSKTPTRNSKKADFVIVNHHAELSKEEKERARLERLARSEQKKLDALVRLFDNR